MTPHSALFRSVAAVAAAGILLGGAPALAAAADAGGRPTAAQVAVASSRGGIVSVTRLDHFSAAQVATALHKAGFDPSLARYGISSYRLVYRTVDVDGRPTTASGLLVLPRTAARSLPVVSYAHGTMAAKADGPSVDANDTRSAVYSFAAGGYATVAPDYLGLGRGPGFHPYMHAASEASASLDLLRAAQRFAVQQGLLLQSGVHVSGFSEGGPAAMALGRSLAAHDDPYFRLAVLAPISGPYDLAGAEVPAALAGRLDPKDSAFYLGYALTSYNRIYHLYDDPAEVFRAPYASTMDSLFDGTHSDEEVFAGVADTPGQLLTPEWLRRLRHPTGRLAAAFAQTDSVCTSWTPRVPVHLFAAHGDEQVAFANSQHCAAALRGHGARVALTDLGALHHMPSQIAGVPLVLRWFDRN